MLTGGNLMMASGNPDEILAQVGSSATTSYLRDGVNSTVALTSSNAGISANYYYSPYGDSAQTGSTAAAFQYTGRENDGATGLYYFRARYYSPQLGRFISEDPMGGGGGSNFYAYAGGNPISLRDPLGLFSATEAAVGFGDGVSTVLTLGLWSTANYRAAHDIGSIDMCSPSYRGGKYFGWFWGGATLWAAGLNGGANSVFWSGYSNGARGIAQALEGTTLESTPIGSALDFASNTLGIPGLTPLWNVASATFALNASGTVQAVILAEGATWASIELPILTARGVAVATIF